MKEITYDSLFALNTGYTDHVYHFRALFDAMAGSMPMQSFFEWGCGYSTKLFMDAFTTVRSVEIVTPGTDQGGWMKHCVELFGRGCWKHELFQSERVSMACAFQNRHHKSYSTKDPAYLYDLHEFTKPISGATPRYEIVFVDPGVVIRGDLVHQALINDIPIVVAHDTNHVDPDVYGWGQIDEWRDYERIVLPAGKGTTMWINREQKTVAEKMRAYAATQ